MSTVGWHRLNPSPVVSKEPVTIKHEPLEHYDSIKVEKDASEGQKEFARRYNNMRKKLLDAGLMQEK